MKFVSDRLIRIGPVRQKAEEAIEDIRSGRYASVRLMNGQEIVVGVCNRVEQRWQEPQFLTERICIQADQQPVPPSPAAGRSATTRTRSSSKKQRRGEPREG